MADHAFSTGTIVWLKSGGPPMTVSNYPGRHMPETVDVEWFNNGELNRDQFHKDCLQGTEPDHV